MTLQPLLLLLLLLMKKITLYSGMKAHTMQFTQCTASAAVAARRRCRILRCRLHHCRQVGFFANISPFFDHFLPISSKILICSKFVWIGVFSLTILYFLVFGGDTPPL